MERPHTLGPAQKALMSPIARAEKLRRHLRRCVGVISEETKVGPEQLPLNLLLHLRVRHLAKRQNLAHVLDLREAGDVEHGDVLILRQGLAGVDHHCLELGP